MPLNPHSCVVRRNAGGRHAFRGEGAGFCVFDDLAIAIEWARSHGRIRRAAVIDLDVHQGDGTAAIFADDPDVFTLSLRGAHKRGPLGAGNESGPNRPLHCRPTATKPPHRQGAVSVQLARS